MLHLVGATQGLDKLKALREFNANRLQRIGHGIYCDMEDAKDLPAFLKANAVRIANFLYPQSALSHASAFAKGAVPAEDSTPNSPKFKLFLSGPYHKVNELKIDDVPVGLTIVQYDALSNREVTRFCDPFFDGKDDKYGPMKLMCASPELVFLQNFGRKGAHKERALSDKDMLTLREELEATYGKDLYDRLYFIVRNCLDFGRELELAANYLKTPIEDLRRKAALASSGANVMEFTLGWYGREVAKLGHNGVNWAFNYTAGWGVPLQSDQPSGTRMPAFLSNLLPEGGMLDLIRTRLGGNGPGNTMLEQSRRFMSNIAIVQDADDLRNFPTDAIEVPLRDHCDKHGVFKGRVLDVPPVGPNFMAQSADLLCRMDMTRIAGMQPKMAVHLSYDGDLVPAVGLPTTHILKFPGVERDGRNLKGVVEWASMSLAEGSGMPCSKFALVELQGEPNVLGLISERFDIPQNEDDLRMLFAEDLCSMMGLPPAAKGLPMLNDVIKKIREQTTDWKADGEDFFRLNYVNYVLENADFHLKNASLLKVAKPMLDGLRSVRLAPAYDIMRTAYFLDTPIAGGGREPLQLGFKDAKGKLKDNNFSHQDLEELAQMCDISKERAQEIMFSASKGIADRAIAMAADLPAILKEDQYATQRDVVLDILERAIKIGHEFFPQLPSTLGALEVEHKAVSRRRASATA